MEKLPTHILNVPKRGNPESLLHLMRIVSLVSITVIISLTGYGLHGVYSRSIIRLAEEDAISVSRALYQQEKELLVSAGFGGEVFTSFSPEDIQLMERLSYNFLDPFEIVKIKVYDAGHRVVFSSDPNIIGECDSENEELKRALQGHIYSKLTNKDIVQDLAGEQRVDVDVVETYVPIRGNSGNFIGSFEIYRDVTSKYDEIGKVLSTSLLILTAILSSVFAVSYLILHKGVKLIKDVQGELERNAITDELTGLFNRREILSRAGKEFARAIRREEQNDLMFTGTGFLMIDIDFFKAINDQYGHLCGDEILRRVTERIGRNLRQYDVAGRYGGEEFLVVLPDAGFEQTKAVAERVWSLVRDEPFQVNGQELRVTISLGISCKNEKDKDLESVLKRADDALYQAKHEGRDRIAWMGCG